MIHTLNPDKDIYCPSCGTNYIKWTPTATAGMLRCWCRRCQDEFSVRTEDRKYKVI